MAAPAFPTPRAEAYNEASAAPCPVCGRPLDARVRELQPPLSAASIRRLREWSPGWQASLGACPECALAAARNLAQHRSPHSLQAELLTPYPVYSPEETDLLPTPVRVNASSFYTGQGVNIAFLDSGFYPHPDLARPRGRILCHVDATASEPHEKAHFKQRETSAWHGLMVTAVGAGSGHQSDGRFAGLAPNAGLVLVKTGNRRSQRRISDRDICRALVWVLAHGERFNIRLINISLGGDYPSSGAQTALDGLVEQAAARGMLVIAAAGNGGRREVVSPASAFSSLAVGGVDDQNTLDRRYVRLHNSNYGRGVYGALKPDLVAPSRWLAAPMLPRTWVHNEAQYFWHLMRESDEALARHLASRHAEARFKRDTLRLPLNEVRAIIRRRMVEMKYVHAHYQHVDGTSMAAPIVTGLAAQLLEANPALTPAQLQRLLTATADPLPHLPADQQGAGLVNGARAVAAARRAAGGPLSGLGPSPHLGEETVTFYYYDPAAREVEVAGGLNHWRPEACAPHPAHPGLWQLSLLHPEAGRYAYRFIVDRTRWTRDPENPALEADGCGDYHSVLEL